MIQFRGRVLDSKDQLVKTELGTEMPSLKRWIERVIIPEHIHFDTLFKVVYEWRNRNEDEWTLIEEEIHRIVK